MIQDLVLTISKRSEFKVCEQKKVERKTSKKYKLPKAESTSYKNIQDSFHLYTTNT